jgi:YVTN family beta-propeller protein
VRSVGTGARFGSPRGSNFNEQICSGNCANAGLPCVAVIAQNAYITNSGDGTVTVIDTATSTIQGTIPVSSGPWRTAVTPDGSKVYVANSVDNTVSVIHTATNSVASTIVLGAVTAADGANAVAISPDGNTVYVTSYIDGTTNPFCGPPPDRDIGDRCRDRHSD